MNPIDIGDLVAVYLSGHGRNLLGVITETWAHNNVWIVTWLDGTRTNYYKDDVLALKKHFDYLTLEPHKHKI